MITVDKLSYSFPQKSLYKDISFTIEDGQHCVLTGSNGTGKTTLLDMIVNTDDYINYRGHIDRTAGSTAGFVRQFVEHISDGRSVFEYLCADFEEMQGRIDAACAEMDGCDDYEAVFERYQRYMDEYDAVDGYNHESNIHRQLDIAGLKHLENLPVSVISGGEFKLIRIVQAMLSRPDLLVLDEPDAFLDFENIGGLSRLINSYPGTILAVTHNRFLLSRCFDKVLHIENESLREFDGNYADFSLALLEDKADTMALAKKDSDWIDIQSALVEKLRDNATKVIDPYRGKILHARVSYLARLEKSRTKDPYIEQRDIVIHPPRAYDEESSVESVLQIDNYSLTYDKKILENVSFKLGAHEKAALVGPNGTGKTSLLRDILKGGIPSIKLADGINCGILSQTYSDVLSAKASVYEEFLDLGFNDRESVTEYLSDYGLNESYLDQSVQSLSGGEKNLLQLAKLARGSYQLLLLDEPSSHLDIKSQLALEKAIKEYDGAVLMVSHDFYSIAGCADTIYYLDNGTIRRMSGRAFRKMFYKKYFSPEYLLLEQEKTSLEMQINSMLIKKDFENAKLLCSALEETISKMNKLL